MQLHHQNKLKISEDPLEIIVKVIRFFATFIGMYLLIRLPIFPFSAPFCI